MIVTVKDIQDYFESLCADHVDLLHAAGNKSFARFATDEHITQIVKNAAKNIVVVSEINGQRVGHIDDQQLRRGISLMFASRAVTSGTSAVAIAAAVSKAEDIMLDFLARMNKDFYDECELLQSFELEKISFDSIDGPWLENYYGWLLFVPWKTYMPVYDAVKWVSDESENE